MKYKRIRRPYKRGNYKWKNIEISLDDPRVQSLIEKNTYNEYLRKLASEEGDDFE